MTRRKLNYTKQRKRCVYSLRKKKDYYSNQIETKLIIGDRRFLKIVKPFLRNKGIYQKKINLIGNENVIRADSETAKISNNFFSNVVEDLEISHLNTNVLPMYLWKYFKDNNVSLKYFHRHIGWSIRI